MQKKYGKTPPWTTPVEEQLDMHYLEKNHIKILEIKNHWIYIYMKVENAQNIEKEWKKN